MNFLAHLWLADATGTSAAGAVLGDVVRGRDLGGFPADIALGIRLHRHVDALTDRHPRLLQAREAFPDGARRYSGIVLDLLIDFAMTQQWSRFSDEPLTTFTTRSARSVADAAPWFLSSGGHPPQAAEFADLLLSYASEAGIDRAVRRIATRLSKPALLLDAAQGWQQHVARLQPDLPALIADVRTSVTAFRDGQQA